MMQTLKIDFRQSSRTLFESSVYFEWQLGAVRQRWLMKRSLGVLGGCSLTALLLAAVGAGVLYHTPVGSEFPGGMRPSYEAANYDPRLTREASTATVVIAALNHYRSKHSVFPAVASQLAPYLPSASATPDALKHGFVCGWYYWKTDNGRGYDLARKLGWDPVLHYEYHSSKGRWVFDPGDGSADKTIILKP
jgi:hypothetical protein